MKLDAADIRELEPIIAAAVRATLAEIQTTEAKLNGRLGYPEPEAAALLGIERHALRDARLRGEVSARKIGKRVVYSRSALLGLLGDGGPQQ
jgi:hypothetical protein